MTTLDDTKKRLKDIVARAVDRKLHAWRKGIEHDYLEDVAVDALAHIQQLEAERDAAVKTIYEMAECITEDVCEWCDGVECERLCMQHTVLRPGFKWRGVQREK